MTDALDVPPSAGPARWIHEDKSGISVAAARALRRSEIGDWNSGPVEGRMADLRAWLVFRAYLAAKLAGQTGTSEERGAFMVDPAWVAAQTNPENERARAMLAIGRTGKIFARAVGTGRGALTNWAPDGAFYTVAGASDTGALPLMVVAVVTVVVAVAESAAIAYIAHEARAAVENYLARDQTLKDLVRQDAQVLRVLDVHAEREEKAGKNLPLDDAEKAALGSLEKQQDQAEARLGKLSEPVKGGELSWWTVPLSVAAAVGAALIFGR